jgi:predicted NAD/FAD-binding protein
MLERCGGNKREACRVLGISYHTLQAYLHYRDRPRRQAAAAAWTDRQSTQAVAASES